jgi:hypothetical protein
MKHYKHYKHKQTYIKTDNSIVIVLQTGDEPSIEVTDLTVIISHSNYIYIKPDEFNRVYYKTLKRIIKAAAVPQRIYKKTAI